MDERLLTLTGHITELEAQFEACKGNIHAQLDTEELEDQIKSELSILTEACKILPKDDPYRINLKTLVAWLHDVYSSYQINYKEAKLRQIKRFHPDITMQQVEALMVSDSIFDARVLYGTIDEQYTQVRRLEESVKYMNRLFIEMNAVVVSQAEPLQISEQNVQNAVTDLESGVRELQRSKSNRKALCIVLACVIILATAITAPIVILLRR